MSEQPVICASEAPQRVAQKYVRDMSFAALVYAVVLVASVFIVRRLDPPQWIAVMLALASAAPALLMMRAYLRRLRGLDEFQRQVQLEAMLASAAIVGFASFTYGFLESFAGFPAIDGALLWVFPAMCFVWGIAQVFVARRYQ
ncbi:MAG: hypothetical protein JNM59_10455 [Hyphomonadaceae bacterium]|nr:hypothetical protein [Hyphomonadaceae bacterium]